MTSLYSKPTDYHQYLHCKSSHPEHTKQSIGRFIELDNTQLFIRLKNLT